MAHSEDPTAAAQDEGADTVTVIVLPVAVMKARSWNTASVTDCILNVTPLKISLVYGLQGKDEAYLLPDWRLCGHRCQTNPATTTEESVDTVCWAAHL